MKISVLSPNLSGNCLGRAYVLAQLLRPQHEVEIVGPLFSDKIWPPLAKAADGIEFKPIPLQGVPVKALSIKNVVDNAVGDVIIASKPLYFSFGAALRCRKARGVPVILDVDDWEEGFIRDFLAQRPLWYRLAHKIGSVVLFHRNFSLANVRYYRRRVREADAVIVSNKFLQDRFGGTLIRHLRDPAILDPTLFDRDKARQDLGLDNSVSLVLFLGTPLDYKGIEDLIDAMAQIGSQSNAVLMLVGAADTDYAQAVCTRGKKILGGHFIQLGNQPFDRVGAFMAAADCVVVPQRRTPATAGQFPAKIFDALCMGRPLVATAVADVPDVVSDAGWIVPPNDPPMLAEAITEVLSNKEEAEKRGARGRERCIKAFSFEVGRESINRLLESVIKTKQRGPCR